MDGETLMAVWWVIAMAFIAVTAVCVVLLLAGAFQQSGEFAARAIYIGSFVTGALVWIGSAILIYLLWGLAWLIGALLFLGFGVSPLALMALAFAGYWQMFLLLTFMTGFSQSLSDISPLDSHLRLMVSSGEGRLVGSVRIRESAG